MTNIEIEKIHAAIANLNAETMKMIREAKYEHYKVVAYVVGIFTAAFFLAFKVAGII